MITSLPTYKGPIESVYLIDTINDVIDDMDIGDEYKHIIKQMIAIAVSNQDIGLIGYYTGINIIYKPIDLSQFDELLLDYLMRQTHDVQLLCKILDDNTIYITKLLPSETNIDLMINTNKHFGKPNDIIKLALSYCANNYSLIVPMK